MASDAGSLVVGRDCDYGRHNEIKPMPTDWRHKHYNVEINKSINIIISHDG